MVNLNAVNDESFYNQTYGGNVKNTMFEKNGVKIICIDDGVKFKTLMEASIYYNIDIKDIKKTFKSRHSRENFINEPHIFRAIDRIDESEFYCCIRGTLFQMCDNNPILCKKCTGGIFQCVPNKKHKPIVKCLTCKRLIIKSSNSKKYCESCAKENNRNTTKERATKIRNNNI